MSIDPVSKGQAFHPFPRLPNELKIAIFNHAIEDANIGDLIRLGSVSHLPRELIGNATYNIFHDMDVSDMEKYVRKFNEATPERITQDFFNATRETPNSSQRTFIFQHAAENGTNTMRRQIVPMLTEENFPNRNDYRYLQEALAKRGDWRVREHLKMTTSEDIPVPVNRWASFKNWLSF